MAKRKRRVKIAPFDAANYLGNEKVIAEYLAAALDDPNPDVFLPKLIELHRLGRFPIEKLVTFYPFNEINRAIDDSLTGKVVKPVLRFSEPA